MNALTKAMERLAEVLHLPVLSGGTVIVDAARLRMLPLRCDAAIMSKT